jgi:FeS assembly SUF system protein
MKTSIRDQVIDALRAVHDPEIPVNIYDIGLIYEVNVDGGTVEIVMTLTSPMCPVAEMLPAQVEQQVAAVDGVTSVSVEIAWDPPWSEDLMSEAARLELGLV